MNKTVKDLKVEIETDVGFSSVCSDYHWIIEELLWAYSCIDSFIHLKNVVHLIFPWDLMA